MCVHDFWNFWLFFDIFSTNYLNLENYAKSSVLLVIRSINFRKNLEQPTRYTVNVDIRHFEWGKLRISSSADPDPGSGIRCLYDLLDLGSGMSKKSTSGSGMNIPDHISESSETMFFFRRGLWTTGCLNHKTRGFSSDAISRTIFEYDLADFLLLKHAFLRWCFSYLFSN